MSNKIYDFVICMPFEIATKLTHSNDKKSDPYRILQHKITLIIDPIAFEGVLFCVYFYSYCMKRS